MEERDKLLEAARMIYDNCVKHAVCKPCIFADGGMCKGTENCSIGNEIKLPYDWRIPKPCRWTGRDYNLAKALDDFGVDVVEKCRNDGCVRFGYNRNSNEKDRLPVDSFSSLKDGELVELIDIIAEYEKCNGGK